MKKILFDLLLSQPTGTSKFHGGGEYMKRVFRELVMAKPDDAELVTFFDHTAFLDEWLLELMKAYSIRSYDIKSMADIRTIFAKESFDIFYSGLPYEYRKEYFPEGIYKIGTFHGMRGVECPHDVYEYKYAGSFAGRVKEQVRTSLKDTPLGYERNRQIALESYTKCLQCFDKLVCDSYHTAHSLLVYYPWLKQNDLEVCYPPLKYGTVNPPKETEDGRYILLMGGDRWLKNTYRCVKAIDGLYERGRLKNVKTVVVGGLSARIQAELKHKGSFVVKGYVDDSELNGLYSGCAVFLYPTLNEGFGYPPLEAMRYGRTCVVSGVCSLPEICGAAVYYVNPYDLGEIQNRVLWALEEPIPEETVRRQFEKITKQQESDLKKVCSMIIRGRDHIDE